MRLQYATDRHWPNSQLNLLWPSIWQFQHTDLPELPVDVAEPAVSMDSFPTKFARNWDTRRLLLTTAFCFSCKNTCRGELDFVVSVVVLGSLKCSCFRGVDETHRRFTGSLTIVLSVLTCTAWPGVAFLSFYPISLYAIRHIRLWHALSNHYGLPRGFWHSSMTAIQLFSFHLQPFSSRWFWVDLVFFSLLASIPELWRNVPLCLSSSYVQSSSIFYVWFHR